MAALTRSGARKASEIVMLIFRAQHLSRFAMLTVVAERSVTSSSSQRRPRAIDATNVARVSDRIGQANCIDAVVGMRISRRRVEGVFCHGTRRVPSAPARLRLEFCAWRKSDGVMADQTIVTNLMFGTHRAYTAYLFLPV